MRYELFAVLAAFLLLAGCPGAPEEPHAPADETITITTFDECAAAGYPVMESHPRQCALPDGTTFTEVLAAEEELPDTFEGIELTFNETESLEDLDALQD
jgi:hypothetical protein